MKAPHVHYSKTPEAIEMMKAIKKTYDPKGILSQFPLQSLLDLLVPRYLILSTFGSWFGFWVDPYKYVLV